MLRSSSPVFLLRAAAVFLARSTTNCCSSVSLHDVYSTSLVVFRTHLPQLCSPRWATTGSEANRARILAAPTSPDWPAKFLHLAESIYLTAHLAAHPEFDLGGLDRYLCTQFLQVSESALSFSLQGFSIFSPFFLQNWYKFNCHALCMHHSRLCIICLE